MGLETLSDHELMMLLKASGAQVDSAFAELIRRHQDSLLNYFRRMGAHIDEAEDLVQETFLRVFAYRKKYEPVGSFASFLYVLARHAHADLARRALRAERRREASGCTPADSGFAMDVQEALDKLSEPLRSAVVLSVFQGLSYQEIAEVLGVPLGTVKSRIHAGMKRLREELDG